MMVASFGKKQLILLQYSSTLKECWWILDESNGMQTDIYLFQWYFVEKLNLLEN